MRTLLQLAGVGVLRRGDRLKHYEIRNRIGSGGFAHVYEAVDRNLDRRVAIKVLKTHHARSECVRTRFLSEAKILARISNRHLTTVYQVDVDGDLLWMAMEYLEGWTAGELLAGEQPLPVGDVLHFMCCVADGVASAHDHGIVHRDIKPENTFLTQDGHVKVMDFGLAKLFDAAVTSSQQTVGTVPYMSPEQVAGLPVDFRSDIYALGLLMYELLTGQPAFVVTRNMKVDDVLYMHQCAWPRPLRDLAWWVDQHIADIVWRAIQKRPEQRYQSAQEFQHACQLALSRFRAEAGAERAAPTALRKGLYAHLLADFDPLDTSRLSARYTQRMRQRQRAQRVTKAVVTAAAVAAAVGAGAAMVPVVRAAASVFPREQMIATASEPPLDQHGPEPAPSPESRAAEPRNATPDERTEEIPLAVSAPPGQVAEHEVKEAPASPRLIAEAAPARAEPPAKRARRAQSWVRVESKAASRTCPASVAEGCDPKLCRCSLF